MNALPGSVSDNRALRCRSAGSILIVGTNWLGDSVMSMPALRLLRQECPRARLGLLVRESLVPLWRLFGGLDRIHEMEQGLGGSLRTAGRLRQEGYEMAFLLPHSFRSAWVPFLARIPARIGTPGQLRDMMLTERILPEVRPGREHQCYEALHLLAMDDRPLPDPPYLRGPDAAHAEAVQERLLGRAEGTRIVALVPGAARGPSKRWPEEHFAAVGRRLIREMDVTVAVLGSVAEGDLCRRIALAIGPGAVPCGGATSLADLAAFLTRCAMVVANDSGGMHLAAALGVPVVGIFGRTDPRRTGPLGPRARIVGPEEGGGHRDIPRHSADAEAALVAIAPDRVFAVAAELAMVSSPAKG